MADKQELEKREQQSPAEVESRNAVDAVAPDADVIEQEQALVVVADMPGCDDQSVDIHVERGILTIEGRAHHEREEGYRLEVAEYRPTSYRRSFTLSNQVDVSKIEASMKDGVLRIVLPKAEEARVRKIQVQTS
jgi:HSP20 family molecular chaperone IbpA